MGEGLSMRGNIQGKLQTFEQFKREGEFRIPQLDSHNRFDILTNINQVTIKDKIPLSLIGEVINKLKKAKYFNKLDLI